MKHWIDISRSQSHICCRSHSTDEKIQDTGKGCADHTEGQPEYQPHNSDKRRNCRVFSGQKTIYFHTSRMFPAFFWLYHRLIADLFNKGKTHICNRCCTIQTTFLLHLTDDMLQHLFLILIQMQLFFQTGISLCQFGSGKSYRNPSFLSVILDQMHDTMKTAVHCAPMLIGIAEVLASRLFLIFRHMDGMINQLLDSLIFRSRNRDHRNSQQFLHLVYINRTTVFPDLIHHIQCQNHRNIQLH